LKDDGEVVNTSSKCACRPCEAGECYCGNGRVEPGEECDTLDHNQDPCCQNCHYTTDLCDDGKKCTIGDVCDGAGLCVAVYKCPRDTECRSYRCDNATGDCLITNVANGTGCTNENGGVDLCLRRCEDGVCTDRTMECEDKELQDCSIPVCQAGNCVPRNLTNTTCSDGDKCTYDDHCVEGVCKGTPKECKGSGNPCKRPACINGVCTEVDLSGGPCNADNNNCTVGDYCHAGTCIRGPLVDCSGVVKHQCKSAICVVATGDCLIIDLDRRCDDDNICTTNDHCINGSCIGESTNETRSLVACGAIPPEQSEDVGGTSLIVFTVAGAAALIAAIAGIAFLIKKIRDSKLLNPDTWDPDKFTSIDVNPLYSGLENVVDNPLAE